MIPVADPRTLRDGVSNPVLMLRTLLRSSMRSVSVTSRGSTPPGRKPGLRPTASMSSVSPRGRRPRPTWPRPRDQGILCLKSPQRWICAPQWPCRVGHLDPRAIWKPVVTSALGPHWLSAMRATSNTGELSAIYHALEGPLYQPSHPAANSSRKATTSSSSSLLARSDQWQTSA